MVMDMENIEEILSNKRIFQVKNYENVYLLLERYVETYSNNFIVRKKLQNKLFMIYLQKLETKAKKPKMSKKEKESILLSLETEMKEAAKNLDFERAMELRDILFEMKKDK